MRKTRYDATIVGAGPNGLTAAAVLAAVGLSVVVLEGNERIGGGCSTESVTLPGFAHDVCSAIHPMGRISPVFRRLQLETHGLDWVATPSQLAHPLDDGRVALLERNADEMASTLGEDSRRWNRLMRPFVDRHEALFESILRPIRGPIHLWLMARFGWLALRSAHSMTRRFTGTPARALFAGCAAHSFLPLDAPGTASFGLAMAIAGHVGGWPCAHRGSQEIAEALAVHACAHGCEVCVSMPVRSLADVPQSHAVLFDVTPRQLEVMVGEHLSSSYRARLRAYRYGTSAFKIDYALAGPIPWRSPACAQSATVHLGGAYEASVRSEADTAAGRIADAPFVLIAQQSLFDSTRAPVGRHTGWAYCHVPHGSDVDMTSRIERQIERFAPGFRDLVLARHVMAPAALEEHNPNLIGGDINGGSNALDQFIARPFLRWNPYTTSNRRLYLCSSSTPPGGGVHSMCGYWAARVALRRMFNKDVPEELAG